MFIQTEETPNPTALKFLPSRNILGAAGTTTGSITFTTISEAAPVSPLAESLLSISGVCGVMLGRDFITVTRQEQSDWDTIRPQVIAVMLDHFNAGMPIIINAVSQSQASANETPSLPDTVNTSSDPDLAEIVAQIQELLDTRVRPAVAGDGGDIVFHGFKDGIVYLSMRGACSGCPRSTLTLKMGVENLLRHYVPEVIEVREVAEGNCT